MWCSVCNILKIAVVGGLIVGFLPIWRHPDEPGSVTGFEAVKRSAFGKPGNMPPLIPIEKAREIAGTATLGRGNMHRHRPFGRRSHVLTDMAVRGA